MNRRVSLKQMLIDLTYILPQAKLYAKGNDNYNELLIFLNSKNYYFNEEEPVPSLKEISKETCISIDKLRRQIKNLYLALVDRSNGFSFNFNRTEVIFTAEFLKNYTSFKCENLHIIPKVGESVDIPFFKGKLGVSMFYVKHINHSFVNDKQIIDVRLQSGIYNKYSHFRLDKALATGEVGRMDFFNFSECEILDRLGLRS